MNNFSKTILIFLLFALIAAPLASFAIDIGKYDPAKGLVPCGTTANPTPCNLCYLYILIRNILDFLMWYIAPIVAVLAIGIAGFKILISGDNPGSRNKGFEIIRTTVTGLVIMFAAWVVMNEALLFFTQPSDSAKPAKILQSPWNEVKCSVQ